MDSDLPVGLANDWLSSVGCATTGCVVVAKAQMARIGSMVMEIFGVRVMRVSGTWTALLDILLKRVGNGSKA